MGIIPTLLIVQEHVNVFNAILKDSATPFDLIEEQLTLKTAGNLKGCSAIAGGDSVVDEQLALDLGLDRGLQASIRLTRHESEGWTKTYDNIFASESPWIWNAPLHMRTSWHLILESHRDMT